MISIPRLVLDTNILVAASRSREGASFALLRLLRQGRFMALLSVPLLLEYESVLCRPQQLEVSRRNWSQTQAFLDAFCLYAEPVVLHYLWRPQLRDPADEMVLETALNGRADALVTLNERDFAQAASFGLAVCTPGAMLHVLSLEL